MTRRAFDEIAHDLKASLLEHAARFFEQRGVTFDLPGYEAQTSFGLEDATRELVIFGANLSPAYQQSGPADNLTIAA
ncbi:hypothetical protein EVC20_142 [Rhizobium phage RHph_Y2_17_1]|nr:hypothetical protein EVC19_142 [Rhizobium phage RHph_Y2_11]QIG75881.1 hypothetical protein EVC20_142 [Rhizobium phage RHph_Y2_17_1]